jgi:hypothetical protein
MIMGAATAAPAAESVDLRKSRRGSRAGFEDIVLLLNVDARIGTGRDRLTKLGR